MGLYFSSSNEQRATFSKILRFSKPHLLRKARASQGALRIKRRGARFLVACTLPGCVRRSLNTGSAVPWSQAPPRCYPFYLICLCILLWRWARWKCALAGMRDKYVRPQNVCSYVHLSPLNNVLEIYAGWEESLSSVTPLDLKPRAAWYNG